jgi:hypothetical protein
LLFLSLSAFPRRKVTGTRPKGTPRRPKVETTISIPPTHHITRSDLSTIAPSSSYRSSGWSGHRTSLPKTGAVLVRSADLADSHRTTTTGPAS